MHKIVNIALLATMFFGYMHAIESDGDSELSRLLGDGPSIAGVVAVCEKSKAHAQEERAREEKADQSDEERLYC